MQQLLSGSNGIFFLFMLFPAVMQTDSGLEGKWISEDKFRKIEIYKREGELEGKTETGQLFLKGIKYDPKKKEFTGKLLPPNGSELPATIEFKGKDSIQITGRKLLFKKSFFFIRVKQH